MAQQLMKAHKAPEIRLFAYNEKLEQLKCDFKQKWLREYDETEIPVAADLEIFLKQFSDEHNLKTEIRSQLEEYDDSPQDFKETLIEVAKKLNQDGKTYIILIDEVNLKNVLHLENFNAEEKEIEKSSTIMEKYVEVDLSFVAEFQNIHFIFCLRSAIEGLNNFTIRFPKVRPNQFFACLKETYRNAEPIQKIIKNLQSQIEIGHKSDGEVEEGYPMMGEIICHEKLPPPLIPFGYNSCVIWVPTIPNVETEAVERICAILDNIQDEENPSVAILHSNNKSKSLAKKIIPKKQKKIFWRYKDVNFNGGEADIVVFITDCNLNIQTLARARRLLVILTSEVEWNFLNQKTKSLKKAVDENLVEMERLKDCPYEMKKCCHCGSKDYDDSSINHHIQECPEREVSCRNKEQGCELKFKNCLIKNHEKTCEYALEMCGNCDGSYALINMARHKKEVCPGRPFYLKCKFTFYYIYFLPAF